MVLDLSKRKGQTQFSIAAQVRSRQVARTRGIGIPIPQLGCRWHQRIVVHILAGTGEGAETLHLSKQRGKLRDVHRDRRLPDQFSLRALSLEQNNVAIHRVAARKVSISRTVDRDFDAIDCSSESSAINTVEVASNYFLTNQLADS